ncbi:MAG: HAD hydrolase-like protein, partial [Gammaproteobacteria bacterium]|nr:HAD hydrolase-like protein [Gammaproteobacteria bacterium]
MKLQALIFDVDGTLADTEEAHRQAFNLAFAEAGLGWNWDRRLYGELLAVTGGKERIRHYVEKYGAQAPYAPEDDAFPGYVAQLHQNKTRLYTGLLEAGGIPLRPGIYRLLKEAHDSGLKLAIATTTSPA